MPLLTPQQAAEALGVSLRHVKNLIAESDANPRKARWRFGRELVNLSPRTSERRTIRINLTAVLENA